MTLAIKDGAGALTNLATSEVSGTHTPEQRLVGDAQTDLAAIKVSVAATATSLAAQAAKLQAIADAQAVPSGGPKIARKLSITTTSNTQFDTQLLARGMVVTNEDAANNLLVSVVTSPTTAQYHVVRPGLSTPFLACANANAVYLNSAASTVSAANYVGV